ncbi:MAG: AAA family ATPase, partial [Anaerolineae bacterium]|nr:AAA family ATPase [Anaerolineae bacterium]
MVGTTGSGKTTLARQLADHLGCPHVEMDALHWTPDWTPSAVFQAEVAAALSGACWVTDGNYGAVRDLIWQQADTLVWLDYPLPVVMWRLWQRSV